MSDKSSIQSSSPVASLPSVVESPGAVDAWIDGGANLESAPSQGLASQAIHAIRRWWAWALPVGLVLAAGGAALFYFVGYEPNFRASCWFRINVDREFIVFPSEVASERFVETQIELVRSPLVLSPVVRQPEIAQYLLQNDVVSPLNWLSGKIEVKLVGQSEFLEIAFACDSESIAEKVVDAVAASYLKIYEQDTDSQRQQVFQLLEEEKQRTAKQVERRREDVRMQSKLALGTDPFLVNSAQKAMEASRRAAMVFELERSLSQSDLDLGHARSELRALIAREAPAAKTEEPAADAIERLVAANQTVSDLQTALKDKDAERKKLSNTGTSNPDASLDEEISRLTGQIEQAKAAAKQNAVEDLRIESWRQQLASQKSAADDRLITQKVALDSAVRMQEAVRSELRRELEEMDAAYRKDQQPAIYRRLVKQIKEQDAETARVKAEVKSMMVAEYNERRSELNDLMLSRFDEVASRLRRLRTYRDQYAVRAAELSPNADDEEARRLVTLDMEFAQRELEREEAVHQRIADRLLELRTEERAPRRVTRRTDEAIVSNTVTPAMLYRKAGLASLLGFCAPFLAAIAWDLSHRRIYEGAQVRSAWNLPLLGEVARLPDQPRLFAPVSRRRQLEQKAVYEESILNLASQLSFSTSLKDVKVIVVASAVGGEGKSTLSSQLAAGLAQSHDDAVLLIDADLRCPSIASMLAVKNSPGLANVLQSEVTIKDAITPTTIHNLYVLPAGDLKANPHVALGNGSFPVLLANLRPHFRFIVVDTPPVLTSGEALCLAREADATVLSTLRDVSLLSQVSLTLEKLASVGSRTVGVVVSGVSSSRYRKTHGAPSSQRT